MADSLHGSKATIDIAGDAYDVLYARIDERLDSVPRLEAKLWKEGDLPRPKALLDGEVTFQLGSVEAFDDGRKFTGKVIEAERRFDSAGRPFVRVVVSPAPFNATKRTDVRTFQKLKVDEIVKKTVEGGGIKARFSLTGSYEARDYVVQYRETDFDFIRRILSEEGIAFTFDHESGEMVFFDDPHGLGEAPEKTLMYHAEFGFEQAAASVFKLHQIGRVVSDKIFLREYDPKRPRFNVEGEAEGADEGGHGLEVYRFPARSVKEAVAKQFAQVLLDSIQCRRDVVDGSMTSWSLAPGYRFSIEGHPLDELNTELLAIATTIEHFNERSQVGGSNYRTVASFEAIPTARSNYRPERLPRARSLPGIQTGKTTGASGQEVHVDDSGCVNVQLPWDREGKNDETSSLPMRTLQLPTGGSMLLPRVGWEVFVQHDEGDVDLPFVTARVYNALTPPPYALPAGAARSAIQTATTPGGGSSNEMRFDDTKGSEEMFINGSKDASVTVNNNQTTSVTANATLDVGSNQTIDITNSLTTSVGANQSVDVGGNQKSSVETFKVDQVADHAYDIGGNRDMKVGGDHKHTVTGSESLEVGGMKTDLVVGSISETADGNMSLTVGGARVSLAVGDYNTEVGGNHTENIGAVKAIVSFADTSSSCDGDAMTKIAGAKVNLVDADRIESAGGMFTAISVGAKIVKADNIVFEAESAITLVMGASLLSITPASVAVLALSVKMDGDISETAALILDN
jgi:type VI secretion system secreted protein VgrG